VTPPPRALRSAYRPVEYASWLLRQQEGPAPHLLKRRLIGELADRYRLDTLIETGTYLGDMIWALRRRFCDIESVELQPELYERAQSRFAACPNIHLHLGDSAAVLPEILTRLRAPAIVWLDGHYSGGVTAGESREPPLLAEVTHVLASASFKPVILIDDARNLTGERGWPTLAQITNLVAARADLRLEVRHDIVRILPAS
jgi:hypothetical protein